MTLVIRRARSTDICHILEIQTMALMSINSHHYTQEQIDSLVEHQNRYRVENCDRHITFVAENDDCIIGFASANKSTITGIFVHPDFWRRGIGSELLTCLEVTAKENKHRSISTIALLTAIPFYQSQGYEIFPQEIKRLQDWKFQLLDGTCMNAKMMSKQLLPPPPPTFKQPIERFLWQLLPLLFAIAVALASIL